MDRVLLVDGNNLAYRCKHVYSLTHGTEDVSVTYGVLQVLRSEVTKLRPCSVIVAWDGGTPAFRKKLISEYKKGRHSGESKEDRENFQRQIQVLREFLPSIGVISILQPGVEADDIIYWLTQMLEEKCIVYSNDKDMLQLVTEDDRIQVRLPIKEQTVSADNFRSVVGVELYQYKDYRMMLGDSSDNLKGIQGIGEKMATAILESYGSLEAAFVAAEENASWNAPKLAKTKLLAADKEYLERLRQVTQLGANPEVEKLCRTAIQQAVPAWKPLAMKDIRKFLYSKGFVSLMDGSLQQHFGVLRIPNLKSVVSSTKRMHKITVVRVG